MNNQFTSYDFSKKNKVIISDDNKDKLKIIADKNVDLELLENISWNYKKLYRVEWHEPEKFDIILGQQFSDNNSIESIDILNIENQIDISNFIKEIYNSDNILKSQDDAQIIKLFNLILKDAINKKASDIHLQIFDDKLNIKMRVDGSMIKSFTLNAGIAVRLFTRIKIISGLDITEKRKPQDGRVTVNMGVHPIDLRISTLPSYDSERIVLRLLDQRQMKLNLDNIGMLENQLLEFNEFLNQKNGIILVTGPTGSGKTTTLYAAIEKIKTKDINIMTIEDPIEYKIDGISQTQVNPKINLNFAEGLRSILRQDPDVILVGEIRDQETADIALRASMTGHLVLSTLHTNTPLGAFDRLNELGIDKKMLTSSVTCVVGQMLEKNFNDEGRSGVFELVSMDQSLKDAISESTEENHLKKYLSPKHVSLAQSLTIKKQKKIIH